jgi:hypothetical protein
VPWRRTYPALAKNVKLRTARYPVRRETKAMPPFADDGREQIGV